MKTILVTGALGQIGSELVQRLRDTYGHDRVIASDIRNAENEVTQSGPFELLDVTDGKRLGEVVNHYHSDAIIHLAALLSSTAESKPQLAWGLNMGGLVNALEVARETKCQLFSPSSIAAFGPNTPRRETPQDTIQRPTSMYGVTKVSGELLCDYYHQKFNVDTRGLRFPGLISYVAPPGGGTTDYAVEIYYEAIRNKRYTSYIAPGTFMDMMYMPDALDAVIHLMEADEAKLQHRNAFNITAMSFAPEQIAQSIQKYMPEFQITYNVDPVRQGIADSWPDSIDSSSAMEEWGFKAKYDLEATTVDMLTKLRSKLQVSPHA